MGKMVNIDEALLARASEAVGTDEAEKVVRDALHALIDRENARAIMAFGGSDPDARLPERRRTPFE